MLNRTEDILKAAEDWTKAGHGVALATVHLQPSIIRSLVDQGMSGNFRISASLRF